MKIALVRHSITEGNLAGQYVGRIDHPLCEAGLALARRRAADMPAVERVLCSPMARARQTAALLFPGQTAAVVEGLRECDFGDWEGKCHAQLAGDPVYLAWMKSGGIFAAPGGEEPAAFLARCKEAFVQTLDALRAEGVESAAIVLHGGSMMAVMSQMADPARGFYEWRPDNCCGYLIETVEGCGRLALRAALA